MEKLTGWQIILSLAIGFSAFMEGLQNWFLNFEKIKKIGRLDVTERREIGQKPSFLKI